MLHKKKLLVGGYPLDSLNKCSLWSPDCQGNVVLRESVSKETTQSLPFRMYFDLKVKVIAIYIVEN